MQIFKRLLQLPDITKQTVFLWGPRKAGKSYFIKNLLNQDYVLIDLLQTDIFAEYSLRPSLLRERFGKTVSNERPTPIVIDEAQKCPALLDEVHWLIENTSRSFLLTGSSARKLRKSQANLLGGRAWRREMRPLTTAEIPEFDLDRALTHGLLPSHYLSQNPHEELRGYLADYLKEEISSEAQVRGLPIFGEFLKIAAITSGQALNYTNVAREIGVDARAVRNYFDILEDTLLGFRISPWTRGSKRKTVETDKFYLFDVGVTNFLSKRTPAPRTPEYGFMFEQFILMELTAYKAYREPELDIRFWRTHSKQEVDFIINDLELALEVKSSTMISAPDLKNLSALYEEKTVRQRVVICQERLPRILKDRYGEILILPWQEFCVRLWQNGILGIT